MRPLLIVLSTALLATFGWAQPYAASEGFDRPFLLGRSDTIPGIAVAAEQGEVYAFWDDGAGVMRAPLSQPDGEGERIVPGSGIRTVHATTSGGDLALAWVQRDPVSGRTVHRLRWRGQEVELLEAGQPFMLELAGSPDGPLVLYARGDEGRSALLLQPWQAPARVVRSSQDTISKYSIVVDDAGTIHLSWLEGFNDPNAVGVAAASWTAYYLKLEPDGSSGQALELGAATNPGLSFRTAIGLDGNKPVVLWPTPDAQVAAAVPGQPPTLLGAGTPLGVGDGFAYWIRTSSIVRTPLGAAVAAPANVLWSPHTPELARFLVERGHHYLAWYGPDLGGGFAIHGGNNLSPIELTWRDRLAARMGWNPWAFWQASGGQLLASLFAGVMLTMVMSPLFWLAALMLSRLGRVRRGTELGIIVSVVSLLSILSLINLRSALSASATRELTGTPLEVAAALAASATITWLILRRADNEIQLGILVSACLSTAISVSILSFINFQAWSQTWSQFI